MNDKWMIANVDGLAMPFLDTESNRIYCLRNNRQLLVRDLTAQEAWSYCVSANVPLPLQLGPKSKHDEYRTRFDGTGKRS